MFKLIVSATVLIAVAGKIPNEAGVALPFDFTLKCDRLPADQIRNLVEKSTITEVVRKVSRGWDAVTDDDGNAVPFSVEALDQLLNVPGMAKVCFDAYFEGCGAKAKN